ncbi:Hypothetical_protein [Hexamita inflata]|uniref:Hypothetical_protein n=1 Tax=Hexamita inflata TaxID=28002 RepID=A0AA86RHC5_9EUKA|nr:Hypothetical protein HINF_LOCUS54595 [Hexamita inflata]
MSTFLIPSRLAVRNMLSKLKCYLFILFSLRPAIMIFAALILFIVHYENGDKLNCKAFQSAPMVTQQNLFALDAGALLTLMINPNPEKNTQAKLGLERQLM